MELALSLGDTPKPSFSLLDNSLKLPNNKDSAGFCISLGEDSFTGKSSDKRRGSSDPPVQLDLLPPIPVLGPQMASSQLQIPWLTDALGIERVIPKGPVMALNVNQLAAAAAAAEEGEEWGASLSSPNSVMSCFQMDYNNMRNSRNERNRREQECEGGGDRGSDDDENGSTRKKLRLSKDQSAFLEESFKEHATLNPKQKLALAKQLDLRPRQVEVWFQNRRARTKLKQTEVDCEYLKRCCETLTEENRRLHKELQELRALKTSQPFYMQLPATTLTMCPSCERVATNTTGAATANHITSTTATTATTYNDNGSQEVHAVLSHGKNRILGLPYGEAHQQKTLKAHKMA
ncbi:hypothetical protein RIF29_25169 [Crotalaria pallida]|uniref:Homeobox domain-containing protein n=1 Tax=Crotalaria pallida TaxID=3830 RepID=A0AAN9ER35_CROPI